MTEQNNTISNEIDFDDFLKVEMRIGKILEAENVEGSDKLYKLKVDFGEKNEMGENKYRCVLSGIKMFFTIEELLFKQFTFITNLKPRKIMGQYSEAMILAGSEEISIDNREKIERLTLLAPTREISNGVRLH